MEMKCTFTKENHMRLRLLPLGLALVLMFTLAASAGAAVTITANKSDAFAVDADGDGQADPGDTLEYTVVISNSGTTDAAGVQLDDIIDINTTFVPGSIKVSPVALNDAYDAAGNVSISQPAGTGLLANDFLGLNPGATVTAYDEASANGGTVAVNPDGSFTYDPPAGFTGSDTFTYTLGNSTGSDTGTVTIAVSGMVWFINNTAGACSSACDGRLSHPFTTLAAFNTANALSGGLNPDNNDNIFIYESATQYTGGVTLRSGQKLIGQDATATLASITGLTLPGGSASFPSMNTGAPTVIIANAGGNGVTLSSGNTLRGFTAGNASGRAIFGSGFGTLTISDMIVATNGQALSLSNGTLSAIFSSVTSSGGVNNIALARGAGVLTGTLTVSSGALSGATGNAFDVNGGTAAISIAATIASGSARSVNVTSLTGGSVTFSGAISDTDTGINLATNTGATINFSGALTLSTGTNTAFSATGGGTVSAADTTSTLTTTTGTALNVANTTIGASGLKFRSITSTGGSAAIVLNNTGSSGGLAVSGAGSAGSGGAISNKTEDAINLTSTANISLSYMNINTNSHRAILGNRVNGFALIGSTVSGNGTAHLPEDNGIRLIDTTGAVTLTGNTVTGSYAHNVWLSTTAGSTAAITSLTVTNGSYNSSISGNGFLVSLSNTASIATGTFSGVTFDGNASMGLNLVTNDNAVIGNSTGAPPAGAVTITGSTFTNSGGIGVSFASGGGSGSSNMYVRFVNNTLLGTYSHAVNIVSGDFSIGGTQKVLIDGNTIGNAGVPDSGSEIGEGIVVTQQGEAIQTVTISNNTIRQVPLGRGIDVQALGPTALGQPATVANYSITGNDVNPQDLTGFPLYAIYVAADNQGSPVLVNAAIHDNTVPGTSACDTECGALQGMIQYEVVTAPSTGTLFLDGGGATVSAEIAATNIGTAGKVCSTNTGLTLTGAAPAVVAMASASPADMLAASSQAGTYQSVEQDARTKPAHQPDAVFSAPPAFKKISSQASLAGLFNPPVSAAPLPAQAQSGEAVNAAIGALPAGKSVKVVFRATVNGPALPLGTMRILNQGTVSGSNFSAVTTTDPSPSAAAACSASALTTCTPVDRPDTTVDISRSSASPANSGPVTWTVSFGGGTPTVITGLTASNFALANTGLTNPAILSVTPVGGSPASQWTVAADPGTGSADGSLGLNFSSDTGLSHDITNDPVTGPLFTIDRTPPETIIDAYPADPAGDTSASFTFHGTDTGGSGMAGFECQLDGSGFAACTSPQNYSDLSDGSHTFQVRAKDNVGNADATPGSYTWLVDTTAPETIIDTNPADHTDSDNASFTFHGTDAGGSGVAGFECQLDGSGFAACTSPLNYSGLSRGSHTFQVRAIDNAGSTDATPASFTWAICSASATVVTSADNGTGSLRQAIDDACDNATITFADNLTIALASELAIDKNMTIDGAGRSVTISGGHITRVFSVSPGSVLTLRHLTIANGNAGSGSGGGLYNEGTAAVTNVTFSGNTADGGGGALYTSGPAKVAGSTFLGNTAASSSGGGIYNAEGGVLEVRGSTFSGNTAAGEGGGIYNRSWFQTMIVANCTFSGNMSGTAGGGVFNGNTGTNISVSNCTFSGNAAANSGGNLFINTESGTVVLANTLMANAISGGDCVILPATNVTNANNFVEDGSCSAALSGDPLLGSLADNGGNTQTFALLPGSPAIDAGKSDNCTPTDQRGIARPQGTTCDIGAFELVDDTAPSTSIDSTTPDVTPTNSTTMSFTFNGSDTGAGIESFVCDLDGGGFSACASPQSYSGLADGSHTFQVRAIDLLGNTDPSPASYTWVVDATAADTTIDSNPANPTSSASASFTFSGNDGSGIDGFECQLDGGGFAVCTSPQGYTGLADGSHTFQVRAIDTVGNTDASPASFTWVVDTAAPDTTMTGNPANPTASDGAFFSFTGTDGAGSGIAGFECDLDGSGFSACATGINYTGLADGSHTFQVRAIDGVGLTDATPASYTWVVDTGAPDTTINTNPANPIASISASFTFSGADAGTGIAGFECDLDGVGFSACTSPKNYSELADGSHTFQVRAVDNAGNTDATPASFTWLVDAAAPDTSITAQPANPTVSTSASFSFTGSDGSGTGVTGFECQLDGGGFSACTSPKNYSGLSIASHTFAVRAIDSVGNTDAAPAQYTWAVCAAPAALTGSAGSITATGALLSGTINANNASTTVIFEYGLTTAYGTTVTADQSPVTGTSPTAVSTAISGLVPNTTYHFRVSGTNAGGTTNGLDQTFTTLAPDITIAAEALGLSADADGQVRVSGTVTLGNAGTGPLTGDVAVRFDLKAGSGCAGEQLAQWTETFTGVNIAPNGGTQAFTITAHDSAVNACSALPAHTATVSIEADPADAVEESDEGNNTYCSADMTVTAANLTVSAISPAPTCSVDGSFTGITVTVANTGGAAAPGAVVRLTSDCGLTFTDATLDLADGASQDISFVLADALASCGCMFTAQVDPDFAIAECSGADNMLTSGPELSVPDLVVDNETLEFACADNGSLSMQGTITLRNSGCGPALAADVPISIALHDGSGCEGNQITRLWQTLTDIDIAAGGTQSFAFSEILESDFCTTATHDEVSALVDVDDNQSICEWSGDNNTVCSDKVVTGMSDTVRCQFELDAAEAGYGPDGGEGAVIVTASDTGCPWGAASSADWILVTDASGADNGTVTYTVQENTGSARTGTITIAGKIFIVIQENGCQLTIVPDTIQKLLPVANPSGALNAETAHPRLPALTLPADSDIDIDLLLALFKLFTYTGPFKLFLAQGGEETEFTRADRPEWSPDTIKTLFRLRLGPQTMLVLVFISPFKAQDGEYTLTIGDCSGTIMIENIRVK